MAHKNKAMEDFFGVLLKDNNLKKTSIFKNIINEFEYDEKEGKFGKAINAEDIADKILKGMREAKEKDMKVGIVNAKEAYMKSIQSHSGFTRALNGDEFLKDIDVKVKNIIDNMGDVTFNEGISKTKAESFVSKYLLDSYIPNLSSDITDN